MKFILTLTILIAILAFAYGQNGTSSENISTEVPNDQATTASSDTSQVKKDTLGEFWRGILTGILYFMKVDTSNIDYFSDYDFLQKVVQAAIDSFNKATNNGASFETNYDNFQYYGFNDSIVYGNDIEFAPGNDLIDVNETTVDYQNYTPEPEDPQYQDNVDYDSFDDLQTNVAILVDKLISFGYHYMKNLNNSFTNDHSSNSTNPNNGNQYQPPKSEPSFIQKLIINFTEFLLKKLFGIDLTSAEYKEKYSYLRTGIEILFKNIDSKPTGRSETRDQVKVVPGSIPRLASIFLQKTKK